MHILKNKLIVSSVFVVAATLLVISCKSDFSELQDVPVTVFTDSSITRRDLAYHFSTQRGYNSVSIKIPTTIKVLLVDNKYGAVDYYWFRKFNNWFQELLFANGVSAGVDSSENLDCDNFAMLYKSLMSVAAYKAGDVKEPACALLTLRADNEFGGIPGNGALHMNVLVMTNQGWFIVEPQTGKFTLLENYPNQHTVGVLLM